jgi:septal ring factor EnvC (AmiA/AmiB activator)
MASDDKENPFELLEGKIADLLREFQTLKKERDELLLAVNREKENVSRLEKRLEMFTQDREKVKTRIDQLLHRFKDVEL